MKNLKILMLTAAILCSAILSGCAKKQEPNITSPTPDTKESPAVSETPEVSNEPVKDFVISVEGMEETVSMELKEFDFSALNGPKVSIYIDMERYQLGEFEGYQIVVPVDSGENPIADMQIGFRADKTVDELAPDFLSESYANESITDNGDVKLDSYTARNLVGKGEGTLWNAYLIQTDNGVLEITIRTETEATEGHGARLFASAKTINIK